MEISAHTIQCLEIISSKRILEDDILIALESAKSIIVKREIPETLSQHLKNQVQKIKELLEVSTPEESIECQNELESVISALEQQTA